MANLQDNEFAGGRNTTQFVGSIARTDTAAKTLFTLPAGAIPIALTLSSPAVSNAGTTATVSVGKSGGSGTEFLNAQDVKGSPGSGHQHPAGPAASLFGTPLAAATPVTGIYAETGGASSSGGPWLVMIEAFVV